MEMSISLPACPGFSQVSGSGTFFHHLASPSMFVVRLISLMPFFLLYRLSKLLYIVVYYLIGYRKEVVCDNIRQAFPDKNEQQVCLLAKAFYRRFADFFLEVIKANDMRREDFVQRCRIVGGEQLRQGNTGPVIVLCIHQGNWEWMLHGVSLQLGIAVDPVFKPLHHKGWDGFMQEVRSRFNSRPIPIRRAGRDLLKRGKDFRIFVMLADQKPVDGESCHWVTYLNREAPFYVGAEKLAWLTQYPVYFAQCRRLCQGFYEVEFKPLAALYERTRDDTHYPVIEAYVKAAEEAIREQPETFLWSHRRWKRRRPSDVGPLLAESSSLEVE